MTMLGSGLDQALPFSFGLTAPESIPALIDNTTVSVSNMNSVLFIINALPIIDKAETLMASLFLVWLAAKLPVADCDCIKFHNALAALCRFCDFPPAGYDPRPYTTVSPVPPETILLPALSPTRVTDDRDMDTDSDGGPPAALDVPMTMPARALTEHLWTPTPQPEWKGWQCSGHPRLAVHRCRFHFRFIRGITPLSRTLDLYGRSYPAVAHVYQIRHMMPFNKDQGNCG